jgi:regulatory protein
MNDRLSKEDLTAESIEAVIADLAQSGYLDDEQFSRMWAESRAISRPKGRRAVSQELSSRGVSKETIESVLDSHYPDDGDLVRKVAVRRAESMRHLDKATFRRRLAGYLTRRGFAYGTVFPLLEELWEDPRDLESR